MTRSINITNSGTGTIKVTQQNRREHDLPKDHPDHASQQPKWGEAATDLVGPGKGINVTLTDTRRCVIEETNAQEETASAPQAEPAAAGA